MFKVFKIVGVEWYRILHNKHTYLTNALDRTNLFMTCPNEGRPQNVRATRGQYGLTQSGHLLYKNVIKFADEKDSKNL